MTHLQKAKAELMDKLSKLAVPAISPCASPDELIAVREHLDGFVSAVDTYLLAIGDEAKRSTTAHIDLMQFSHVFRDAVDGFARFELDSAAEELAVLAAEAA